MHMLKKLVISIIITFILVEVAGVYFIESIYPITLRISFKLFLLAQFIFLKMVFLVKGIEVYKQLSKENKESIFDLFSSSAEEDKEIEISDKD